MARMLWLAFLVPACCMMTATPPSSHNFMVVLPPGIPSETVQVTYALGGTFGSYGQTVNPPANKTVYSIPTSVDGLPTEGIQMVL